MWCISSETSQMHITDFLTRAYVIATLSFSSHHLKMVVTNWVGKWQVFSKHKGDKSVGQEESEEGQALLS